MENTDLGTRFSVNTYATQEEVMQALKVPIIDKTWEKILDFRRYFRTNLSLKHITGASYNVCLTSLMVERICSLERKLARAMINYSKLGRVNKANFDESSKKEIIKSLAKKYNYELDEKTLNDIIRENAAEVPSKYAILLNYIKALDEIKNNFNQDINDDFFGKLYSILLGTDDLTEFYRQQEIENQLNRTLVNKFYIGIPKNSIESSMNYLISFIKNSNQSLFVKAVSAYYYLNYIKPFEFYSEEIAILVFKMILCHNDLEEVACYINMESFLSNNEEIEKYIIETQKYNLDITYFLNFVLKKFENNIENFLNSILLETTKQNINEDFNLDYQNENKGEIKKEPIVQQAVINSQQQGSSNQSNVSFTQSIAFSSIMVGLDEDEAQKFENHLKERYPELSSNQAYFYARHCTLGMNYTISQFKKCNNCAYETARTSMDKLVELGFYRKESRKNKFIYVPVKRN